MEELLHCPYLVEEILEFNQVSEDKKVLQVATWLQGRAAAWWPQLKIMQEHRG